MVWQQQLMAPYSQPNLFLDSSGSSETGLVGSKASWASRKPATSHRSPYPLIGFWSYREVNLKYLSNISWWKWVLSFAISPKLSWIMNSLTWTLFTFSLLMSWGLKLGALGTQGSFHRSIEEPYIASTFTNKESTRQYNFLERRITKFRDNIHIPIAVKVFGPQGV